VPARPSNPVIISNSSPLIALDRIGRIDLIAALFDAVVVPPAVNREIGGTIASHPWLRQHPISQSKANPVLRMALGAGESQAIELALELDPRWLILDDRPARRIAQGLRLPVIGTLGLLLAAKRKGIIVAMRPQLEALQRSGFHVARSLFDQILSEADE
jgi:predicted nucleic acid-binding protein